MEARRTAPYFRDISFNPAHIEAYVRMEPLHPLVFDRFCEDGWTYWSDAIFRRNYMDWRGLRCRVVLLRIDLQRFAMSKSQRKCARRNQDLSIMAGPIAFTKEHVEMFEQHARRFDHYAPASILGFFSRLSHVQPCAGFQFDVFSENKLIASSFAHLGHASMAGNYCFYDAAHLRRSLGTYTMLLEIEFARRLGKRYYYPGFVYDVPSEFDYKLNFDALEYFDWWGNWYPFERLAVRRWRDDWEIFLGENFETTR